MARQPCRIGAQSFHRAIESRQQSGELQVDQINIGDAQNNLALKDDALVQERVDDIEQRGFIRNDRRFAVGHPQRVFPVK